MDSKTNTDRNLSAYYYSFDPTGCDLVDAVLESVANAGAGYHNTEDWREERDDGTSPLSDMQAAADKSAAAILALIAEVKDFKQGAKAEADAGDEARAEVRQLKAENERLERNRDMWKAQVEQQAEELTALRKDAERYRFLRSDLTMGGDVDFCIVRKHWKAPALESILSLTNADEQIDAAMTR